MSKGIFFINVFFKAIEIKTQRNSNDLNYKK